MTWGQLLMGIQAQTNSQTPQASYGVDAAAFHGANAAATNGIVGGDGMMQHVNDLMNGPDVSSSSMMMSEMGGNMHGNNSSNNSAHSITMNNNSGNVMLPPLDLGDCGPTLGRLTPPTHPSVHGHDSSSPSKNASLQQNAFPQQPNFAIGTSDALNGESLTTPSPLDMGSATSTSMPQNVLRSHSVGSVQSTASTGSIGSNGFVNSRSGRMGVGRGGFLGPGRARGPGGIGIKRNLIRSRSDGSNSNSNSISGTNNMVAKTAMQTLLRLHASVGGKHPNVEGMCPIHIACRDFPTNARLIGTMLCTSPGIGRLVVGRDSRVGTHGRRASLSSINLGESSSSKATTMEGSYPIHIALTYSATVDVVKLLVRQNPELLIKGDGTNRVPLSIAFRSGASLNVLDYLLGTNPNAAAIPDQRNNYPLHLACARRTGGAGEGINLPILKRLVEAFPAAVHRPNFNGKTPLDLAQDGGLTDDDAISYLHDMAYMENDDDVIEAPDA